MITLTDIAAVKVKELVEAEGEMDLALRVAVRPGGCSGYGTPAQMSREGSINDLAIREIRSPTFMTNQATNNTWSTKTAL